MLSVLYFTEITLNFVFLSSTQIHVICYQACKKSNIYNPYTSYLEIILPHLIAFMGGIIDRSKQLIVSSKAWS